MALQIKPALPYPFLTDSNLEVPQTYAVVSGINFRKYGMDFQHDIPECELQFTYFQSQEASNYKPRAKPLILQGLPVTMVVQDPVGLLASANATAYAMAYQLFAEEVKRVLGSDAIVENA
ncbi:hypothetical protein Q5H92_13845 [Hymenobacter sp. M29]|uniref:Uncharacterized protein n=1 Tax=Hymenobacter mellowenesis TaxID=3063995 RepID=A0ABT9AC75_9BACT|nr:hypothetical protein [Hymenobacter sp. M29]MDO7847448.1 hypothetical protein [Hymenobacter sp. M29]